jgi:hypothetical protein
MSGMVGWGVLSQTTIAVSVIPSEFATAVKLGIFDDGESIVSSEIAPCKMYEHKRHRVLRHQPPGRAPRGGREIIARDVMEPKLKMRIRGSHKV